MRKKRLPDVAGTGRHYVDRTRGGWLVSPGVERHVLVPGRGRTLLAAAVVAAVLVALFLYLRS